MGKKGVKKKAFFFMIIIGILLTSIYIVKPAVTGYGIYKTLKEVNEDPYEIKTALKNLENRFLQEKENAKHYQQLAQNVQGEIKDISTQVKDLLSQKAELTKKLERQVEEKQSTLESATEVYNSELRKYEQEIEKYKDELHETQKKLIEAEKKQEEFAQKTATSICCKARVDDLSINSYSMTDGKILCTNGGKYELVCP